MINLYMILKGKLNANQTIVIEYPSQTHPLGSCRTPEISDNIQQHQLFFFLLFRSSDFLEMLPHTEHDVVLHATEMGRLVYERMGFKEISDLNIYVHKPSTSI